MKFLSDRIPVKEAAVAFPRKRDVQSPFPHTQQFEIHKPRLCAQNAAQAKEICVRHPGCLQHLAVCKKQVCGEQIGFVFRAASLVVYGCVKEGRCPERLRMKHDVPQLVGCHDPPAGLGEISVDADKIAAQKIARKALCAVQVKIDTHLNVHGIEQSEGVAGAVAADKLFDLPADIKPAHKGSLFEISNNTVKMISVDGYRLAIRKEDIEYSGEKTFIVPGKTLSEVEKLISEDTKNVNITVGERHIIFKTEKYDIITRLIEGEFMNYKAAIPAVHSTEIKVNTRKFIDTIDRMSLLLNDRMKSPIRCRVEDGMIKTSCNTAIGQANDEFEVESEGEDIEIGFDNKYILDALKFCETDEVKIQMNGPLSPIVLLPSEGDSFIFLVLPVRLKNER